MTEVNPVEENALATEIEGIINAWDLERASGIFFLLFFSFFLFFLSLCASLASILTFLLGY